MRSCCLRLLDASQWILGKSVDGQPLLRALAAASGGSVLARVVARLFDIALVVPARERWARALTPDEAFCNQWQLPDQASAVGLVEAARGALEQALVGLPVGEGESASLLVQHVVRSFDLPGLHRASICRLAQAIAYMTPRVRRA